MSQCITTTNKLEPVLVVIFAQVALVRFDTEMIITELTRIRNELVQLSKERRHKCSRHRRARDLRRLSDELSEIIEEINLVSGRPTTASRLPATSTDESECPQQWEVERTLGMFAKHDKRARNTSRLRAASTDKREAPQAAIERSLGIVKNENDQARKASRLRAESSHEGERRLARIRRRVEDMENNNGRLSNVSRLRAASTDDSNLTHRPRYKVVFALPNGEYATAFTGDEHVRPIVSAPCGNRATASFKPGEIMTVCEDDTSRESHVTDAE